MQTLAILPPLFESSVVGNAMFGPSVFNSAVPVANEIDPEWAKENLGRLLPQFVETACRKFQRYAADLVDTEAAASFAELGTAALERAVSDLNKLPLEPGSGGRCNLIFQRFKDGVASATKTAQRLPLQTDDLYEIGDQICQVFEVK